MLKMTIDDEEVVSNNNFTIKEEMLGASSTILNNTYPKSWEEDKDYVSRFYYPKDYAKLNIQNFSREQEGEAGTTIQVNGSATLNDVDATKESRVLRLLGQTSQNGTPTPDNPVDVNVVSGDNTINVCGKNLLEIANIYGTSNGITTTYNNGYITLSGTANSSWCYVTRNVPCSIPAGTYTLSITKALSYRIYITLEYEDGTTSACIVSQGSLTRTITTDKKAVYIGITCSIMTSGTTYNDTLGIMLEKGSTATTYEPYTGASYPINLGSIELCKIGTYQDYIYKEDGTWYLHKEIGKVVLDGSEDWSKSSNTSVDRFLRTSTIPKATQGISNYFSVVVTLGTNVGTFYFNENQQVVNYSSYGTTTLAQFKEWLSTNTPIIYYVLSTPTNTEITDTTLIEQLEALQSD